MRFLPEACLLGLLSAAACGARASPPENSPPDNPPSPAAPISQAAPVSREAIRSAAAALRHDPNLGIEHTIRALHWIDSQAAPPPVPPSPWIVGLFEFLGGAGSVILWILGGIGIGAAAVFVYRLLRARTPRANTPQMTLVSHIGGFDIRPTSLPDDVGAAARGLLDAGKTREALSLLYRGALSRAVHRFGVRIDESFTENEALRAVGAHLDAPRTEYFDELVLVWQRAVYAGQAAPPPSVALLCERFAPVLGQGAV